MSDARRRLALGRRTLNLERAMNSEVEAEAVRLAEECAQTLLAYYRAEVPNGAAFNAWMINCDEAWRDHESALRTSLTRSPGRELAGAGAAGGARADRGRTTMSDGRPRTFCRYTATITYRSGKLQTLTELEPVRFANVFATAGEYITSNASTGRCAPGR